MVEAKKGEVAKLDRRERNMLALMTREDLKPGQRIAADSALDRIARRRTALCGLDELAMYRVGVITEDVVDAELRRLAAMLGDPVVTFRSESHRPDWRSGAPRSAGGSSWQSDLR
jgi:hypothetical protein